MKHASAFLFSVVVAVGAWEAAGQQPQTPVLNPNSSEPGKTLQVTVTGLSLSKNGRVDFEPAGNLIVANLTNVVLGDRQLLAFTLQVLPSATPGPYTFVFTPPLVLGVAAVVTQPLRVPNAFTVVAPRPPVTITMIQPNTLTIGRPQVQVQLFGTGLEDGGHVSVEGGGVSASVASVAPPSSAVVSMAAQHGAVPGARRVIWVNRDESNNANQTPAPTITVQAPVVVITRIQPDMITIGEPQVLVQLTGSGFEEGAQISIDGGDAVATIVSVASPSSAMASVAAPRGAKPGARRMLWTNRDQSNNANQTPPSLITLQPAPVVIRSIAPDVVVAGGPPITVQVAGVGFQAGATFAVAGTGVTMTVLSVTPSGSAMAQLAAAANAAPGARVVTITNPDATSNTGQTPPAAVTVAAPQVLITSITPSSFVAGDPPVVAQITGGGFQLGATLSVAGAGVAAKVLSMAPPGSAAAEITVALDAAPGLRTVTIANPDGTSNVNQTPPAQITIVRPRVRINSIAPNSFFAGGSAVSVRLAGVGFQGGAALSVAGNGVAATVLSVSPPDLITATFAVASNATPGPRTVIVANPDTSSNSDQVPAAQITIVRRPVVIRSITPDSLMAGGLSITSQITGEGFEPGATLSVAGAGVAVSGFIVHNPTSATATFSAGADAPPGARTVTLANTDGTSNADQAPPATITVTPKRPLERIEGPRVELVDPDTLDPGAIADLKLLGKNFTPSMKVSFGRDVTVFGVPIVTAPTRATLKVQVAPSASAGTRAAVASNETGSNEGPGGVYVRIFKPPKVVKLPPKLKLPLCQSAPKKKGDVFQTDPKWGYQKIMEGAYKDLGVPLFDDDVVLRWHEMNPGLAEHFEVRFYDRTGTNLLVTRRLDPAEFVVLGKKFKIAPTLYRPDPATVAEILSKVPVPQFMFEYQVKQAGGGVAVAKSSALPGGGATPMKAQAGMSTPLVQSPSALKAVSKPKVQQKQGADLEDGDLQWEVAGFRTYANLCPAGRQAGSLGPAEGGTATIEIETSKRWPLRIPDRPTGTACPASGVNRAAVQTMPVGDKHVYDENGEPVKVKGKDGKMYEVIDNNNYPGDPFALAGDFNLKNSPYATHPKVTQYPPKEGQMFADVASFAFDNLFVDWGDGTLEPVRVAYPKGNVNVAFNWSRDVQLSLPSPNETIQLPVPCKKEIGGIPVPCWEMKDFPSGNILKHAFSRTGMFTIRFFQLGEADVQHLNPEQLALAIDGPQVNPFFEALAMLPGGLAAALSPPAGAKGGTVHLARDTTPTVAGGAIQSAGLSALTKAQTMADIASRAYMIYCHTVTITAREDLAATGPLHLESIEITSFPGHEPAKGGARPGVVKAGAANAGAKLVQPPAAGLKPDGAKSMTAAPVEKAKAGKAIEQAQPDAFTGVKAIVTPPDVTVSDCDESLIAGAKLTYYGKGRARIVWKVDGKEFFVEEKVIGPSEQRKDLGRDPKTWGPPKLSGFGLESDPLGVEKAGIHKVTVEAEVIPEPAIDLSKFAHFGLRAARGEGDPGDAMLAKAFLVAAGKGSAPLKAGFVSPAKEASSGMPLVVSVTEAIAAALTNVSVVKEKPVFVASGFKKYEVVKGDPTQPCTFVFANQQGAFRVSGLQHNVTWTGTKYSGKGVLMLPLTKDSTSAKKRPVPVEFNNWEVPDLINVAAGSLSVAPKKDIDVPGMTGTLDKVEGAAGPAGAMLATLSVESQDSSLRIPGAVEKPPRWDGVAAPISAEGNWYKDGQKLPETLIGWSAFHIKSDDVRLDLSRVQGDGANSLCGPGSGAAWVGIHLGKATLKPYTLDLVGGAADIAVSDWGITSSGMCGAVTTGPFKADIGEGFIKWDSISATAKGGSFAAFYKNMRVHVPWLETEFGGDAEIKAGGGKQSYIAFPFTGAAVTKEYEATSGHITMKAENVEFTQEENIGWTVKSDTKFTLAAEGKHFATFVANDFFYGFDGHAYFKKGATTKEVALGGSSKLGDTPLDLVSVTLVAPSKDKDRLRFSIHTKAHLSEVMPAADAQVNYTISRPDKAYVASGPFTSPFEVNVEYPAGQPTVSANIQPSYSGVADTRYYGHVNLAMFGGPPVDAQFLLGYESGHDYWLTKAEMPLSDAGVTLVPGIMNLYKIRGGLGHNFALTTFKAPGSIEDAKPTFDDSFLFMAGVRVGSADKFTYTLDGDLSVKATGPDAGARMDFHAWILKSNHDGSGDFSGFFQYSAANFDGKLWGRLRLLEDAIYFDLGDSENNAAMDMHFGGGNWHIYAGKREGPRIKAHILIADADSYLMLGNDVGLAVGGSESIYLGVGDDSVASAYVKAWMDIGLQITPQPKVIGDFGAGAEAGVCVFGVCIHTGVTADVHAEALPIDIRARATVELPDWLPDVTFTVHL